MIEKDLFRKCYPDFKKLMSFGFKIDKDEYVYIEYYTETIRYNIAKRFMRFSSNAALVYMTYNMIHKIEIDNLKHIIEGVRYQRQPESICEMLIEV